MHDGGGAVGPTQRPKSSILTLETNAPPPFDVLNNYQAGEKVVTVSSKGRMHGLRTEGAKSIIMLFRSSSFLSHFAM